ncbi:MAG: hypothetical protein JSR13_11760 [Proteobacteria bacterium]|nr:hypothetical protein [Pseudomonadota bacterium]
MTFIMACARTGKRLCLGAGAVGGSCAFAGGTPGVQNDPWVKKYLNLVEEIFNILMQKLRTHPEGFLIFFIVVSIIEWLISERTINKHRAEFNSNRRTTKMQKKGRRK